MRYSFFLVFALCSLGFAENPAPPNTPPGAPPAAPAAAPGKKSGLLGNNKQTKIEQPPVSEPKPGPEKPAEEPKPSEADLQNQKINEEKKARIAQEEKALEQQKKKDEETKQKEDALYDQVMKDLAGRENARPNQDGVSGHGRNRGRDQEEYAFNELDDLEPETVTAQAGVRENVSAVDVSPTSRNVESSASVSLEKSPRFSFEKNPESTPDAGTEIRVRYEGKTYADMNESQREETKEKAKGIVADLVGSKLPNGTTVSAESAGVLYDKLLRSMGAPAERVDFTGAAILRAARQSASPSNTMVFANFGSPAQKTPTKNPARAIQANTVKQKSASEFSDSGSWLGSFRIPKIRLKKGSFIPSFAPAEPPKEKPATRGLASLASIEHLCPEEDSGLRTVVPPGCRTRKPASTVNAELAAYNGLTDADEEGEDEYYDLSPWAWTPLFLVGLGLWFASHPFTLPKRKAE